MITVFMLLNTVPRITIFNITVLESAGMVRIPINRTGGDLSLRSNILANSRDVTAMGEYYCYVYDYCRPTFLY